MGQVLDASSEGVADLSILEPRDPFCKHRGSVGAREGGWGGKMRNSHGGGYSGTLKTSHGFKKGVGDWRSGCTYVQKLNKTGGVRQGCWRIRR